MARALNESTPNPGSERGRNGSQPWTGCRWREVQVTGAAITGSHREELPRRPVSDKMRKMSKEKFKKDEDVEKSAYCGTESFTHNFHLLSNYYKRGNVLGP